MAPDSSFKQSEQGPPGSETPLVTKTKQQRNKRDGRSRFQFVTATDLSQFKNEQAKKSNQQLLHPSIITALLYTGLKWQHPSAQYEGSDGQIFARSSPHTGASTTQPSNAVLAKVSEYEDTDSHELLVTRLLVQELGRQYQIGESRSVCGIAAVPKPRTKCPPSCAHCHAIFHFRTIRQNVDASDAFRSPYDSELPDSCINLA
ncbi:hypothetical protein CC86DRAFT_28150 [Ophiobolus disseminans]|uniref:Uncharacterized protein n=1 Tax=Ophiobolus disseminans TaxID=1469910 RepID=A0A6A6ZZN9_9PLEO|nr:hypothetical protein CC86DRAFT_28150 [Ophiobolus disseminans]